MLIEQKQTKRITNEQMKFNTRINHNAENEHQQPTAGTKTTALTVLNSSRLDQRVGNRQSAKMRVIHNSHEHNMYHSNGIFDTFFFSSYFRSPKKNEMNMCSDYFHGQIDR